MKDSNTGMTIWESAAIIMYLIEQYDKDGKISYLEKNEKYQSLQWLMFQVSGQGPYFGQATWFQRFHPEKLPSAIDRYVKEIERVVGVLDKAVSITGWLVGDRYTFADLSFVTWAVVAEGLFGELGRPDDLKNFINYDKWLNNMKKREAIRKNLELMAEGRAAHGLK
ncbi:MAG: glutathione S- transferase, nitrogen catabolite repression regulator [Bathelium mastoideum]|nr:MAG: glutathione S- transferase, nitrogen catabolite repression regulator [Bathelium mastoideum]